MLSLISGTLPGLITCPSFLGGWQRWESPGQAAPLPAFGKGCGHPSVPGAPRGARCGAASPLPPPGRLSWTGLVGWCVGRARFFQAPVWRLTLRSCKRCVAGFCVLPCTRLHQGWLQCPERIWDVPSACPCWRAVMALCLWQLRHAARGLGAPSSGSCARLLCCTRQVSPGWAWLFPFSRWMGTDCRGRHDHQALPFPGGFPK